MSLRHSIYLIIEGVMSNVEKFYRLVYGEVPSSYNDDTAV